MLTFKRNKLSIVVAAAFCFLFAPAASAENDCESEEALKSPTSVIGVPIEFVNRTNDDLHVYWLNESGKRVSFGQLSSGESEDFNTYIGHIWVITIVKNGDCKGIYLADAQERTIVLN